MAAPTYKARGLVLRKTKLGEKDLIITLLGEQGSLIKAIAKGARKPGGSHAAKLDLFSVVDALFAKGKNLDVICESKLITGGIASTATLEQTAVATPLAELLSIVAQEDLDQPRLYDLSVAAFERIRSAEDEALLTLCAATLWKVLSQVGFKPSLTNCVICGNDIELPHNGTSSTTLLFSPLEGGVVCSNCMPPSDVLHVDANTLSWCNYLIHERFDTIAENLMDTSCAFSVISLARYWTRVHIGKDIRALDFLMTSGLFDEDRKETC